MKRALIFRGLVFTPIHRGGKGGFVCIRVYSWFIRGGCRAVSPSPSLPLSLSGNRGWVRLPLSPSLPLLVCLFLLSCAQPTDSPDEDTVERERIEVSGSIVEDTVWEFGKDKERIKDKG